MLSAWKRQTRVYASVGLLALLVVLLASAAPRAHAQTTPPQEPGVTQRVFQLPRALSEICPIKEGQTPNIDVLKPTIDWSGDGDFGGLTDNFIVHVIANLTVPTAGTYTFRLTSDDGSELFIDDGLVIDHDGLHGETSMDGDVELTAGMHALRVNFFEAGGGQELTLSWRPPGATDFSVVPNSVLSTDAGVVRVTSPGSKQCEGDVDSPGDGLPLDGVNPAYDLVNLRPAGFEPKVTGLEWMGDDLLVLTWGDDDGDPSSVTAAGEVWRLTGVKDADDPADVTPTMIAEDLREPMGIKVVDGDIYISEKHQLSKLLDSDANGVYESKDTDRDVAVRRQLPRVRVRPALQGRLLLPEPLGLDRPRRRVDRAAGLRRSRHPPEDQQGHGRDRVRRRRPAHAARHRLGPGGRDLRHRQPGRLAAGQQADPRPARQVLQPLHDRPDRHARPLRRRAADAAGALAAAQRDRQLAEPADADPERSVRRADVDRRRDLRRDPAGVPGEGRGRVPGRLLPDDPGPRVRHHAPGARGRRLDHRRRARRRRQLGPDRQAAVRPPEARPERHRDVRHPEDGARRGRLRPDLHQAAVGRGARRSWPTSTTCSSGPTCRRRPTAARRSTRRR